MSDVFMSDYLKESINPDTDRYLMELLPARDEVLTAMEREAVERDFPFVGPLAGNLLQMLTRAMGAKQIFELGSGFGYSAVHFARAAGPQGHVVCTDGSGDNKRLAEEYFRRAGIQDRVTFHVGDAVSILNTFTGPFDIIFMDIDKNGYPDAFRAAWPKLRVGGLFITDNIFWHGQVFTDDQRPSTQGVRRFTELVGATPGAQTAIVPVRDGLALTQKLA